MHNSVLESPLHSLVFFFEFLDLLDGLAVRDHQSLAPEAMSFTTLYWFQIELILHFLQVLFVCPLNGHLTLQRFHLQLHLS